VPIGRKLPQRRDLVVPPLGRAFSTCSTSSSTRLAEGATSSCCMPRWVVTRGWGDVASRVVARTEPVKPRFRRCRQGTVPASIVTQEAPLGTGFDLTQAEFWPTVHVG